MNFFSKRVVVSTAFAMGIGLFAGLSMKADSFTFSTGDPDGKMASGARPPSPGVLGIETADDFTLSSPTQINSASFTGLIPAGSGVSIISFVNIDLYHVFPVDSGNPPSGNVPTRTNSPADTEFTGRDSDAGGGLTFTATVLNPSFTAANSVLNGINKVPNQTTGGEGPVSGVEVRIDVTFTTPITLPADHYFFVPTVDLESIDAAKPQGAQGGGDFLWLSAPKPIVAPGTPFTPDLQAWIRNENLDPDWLRIGTDIISGDPAPTFNESFSLAGVVPEPSSIGMLSCAGILLVKRKRSRR